LSYNEITNSKRFRISKETVPGELAIRREEAEKWLRFY